MKTDGEEWRMPGICETDALAVVLAILSGIGFLCLAGL